MFSGHKTKKIKSDYLCQIRKRKLLKHVQLHVSVFMSIVFVSFKNMVIISIQKAWKVQKTVALIEIVEIKRSFFVSAYRAMFVFAL